VYLLTDSVVLPLLAPAFAASLLVATRNASELVRAYTMNFVVLAALLGHAEVLFRHAFPELVIDNLYTIERGYYFNKPRLQKRFLDKEYAVDYRTNHQGIRIARHHDPDTTIERADWLFLGDSYTQGAQVDFEDLYTSRLYQHFPDTIILNTGVSGLGIAQEDALYRNWGHTFQPDGVFLQICSFNDFMNVAPRHAGVTDYLTAFSALARFLLQRLQYRNPAELPLGRWTEPFHPEPTANARYNIFFKASSTQKMRDLELFRDYLGRLARRVRQDGVRLVVLLIPTKEQVSPRFYQETTSAFDIRDDELDMTRPNRLLAELTTELGVEFIDLLPAFQASEEPVFFDYDEHLNTHGHGVLAQALADHLARKAPSLLGAAPHGDRYPVTRDGERLTFQSVRDGNSELFLADMAMEDVRRVTYNDVDEAHPMLTLDGARVLFTEGDAATFETHVTIADVDGTNRHHILSDPTARSAIGVFSPDDTLIAYAEWQTTPTGYTTPRIAILDLLTAERAYLTPPDLEAWRPVFSPDARQVAFIAKHDGQFDVYLHDRTRGVTRQLTTTAYDEWDPIFSPDGDHIVYAAHADGNWDLFSHRLADTSTRRLTDTQGDEWDPSFTPTGTLLYAGRFGLFSGILTE
jgi:lysophospholipase L1-like esterase